MTTPQRIALVLALLAGLAVPLVIEGYWLRVAATALYFGALASSWNLLLGYAGQLSFAHAAFAAVGAYTSGLLSFHFGAPPIVGCLLGVAAAAGLGYLLGRMCLRLRGPYLALMTIGFSEILRLVAQIEHEITRGSLGLQVPYLWEGGGMEGHLGGYYVMLAVTVLTLVVIWRLVNGRVGLYLKSIREDEPAAEALGVDVTKWKTNAFVISAALAGLAGGVYSHLFVRVVAPQNLLLSEMALILAMAIVGGLGSFLGPLLGAVALVFLQEEFREISPHAHLLLFALLVIMVMRFFREGLYGVIAPALTRVGLVSAVPPITKSPPEDDLEDAPTAAAQPAVTRSAAQRSG